MHWMVSSCPLLGNADIKDRWSYSGDSMDSSRHGSVSIRDVFCNWLDWVSCVVSGDDVDCVRSLQPSCLLPRCRAHTWGRASLSNLQCRDSSGDAEYLYRAVYGVRGFFLDRKSTRLNS